MASRLVLQSFFAVLVAVAFGGAGCGNDPAQNPWFSANAYSGEDVAFSFDTGQGSSESGDQDTDDGQGGPVPPPDRDASPGDSTGPGTDPPDVRPPVTDGSDGPTDGPEDVGPDAEDDAPIPDVRPPDPDVEEPEPISCRRNRDCRSGVCSSGWCVECSSHSHCPGSQLCFENECVTPPPFEPMDCSTDQECKDEARRRGVSPDNAACDPEAGCFIIGTCNAGGMLGPDFSGVDPFNAECPGRTTCGMTLDLGGFGMANACLGCTIGNDSTCREGEVCLQTFFDGSSAGSYCGRPGSDFPLPFP